MELRNHDYAIDDCGYLHTALNAVYNSWRRGRKPDLTSIRAFLGEAAGGVVPFLLNNQTHAPEASTGELIGTSTVEKV